MSRTTDLRIEVFAVLLMALSTFTLLSLATYNPLEEPTISEDVAIHNIMGIAGVYVSHYLVKFTLGYVSIVFPIFGLVWGVWLLVKREIRPIWRLTGYGLLLALLTAVFKRLQPESMSVSSGALREGVLHDLIGRLRHEDVRDVGAEDLGVDGSFNHHGGGRTGDA